MENTAATKDNAKEIQKIRIRSFALGAVVGGIIVAAVKDNSGTIKEITSSITKIATSYYGCKFLYNLFS